MSTAAVLFWAAGVANAQDRRPDFSGTWTLDAEKTAAEGGVGGGGGRGGRGGGGPMTIKQDGGTFTIERAGRGGGAVRSTAYKLDGSEVEIAAGRGGTATATASWEGTAGRSRIVIKQTGAGRGGAMQTTTTAYSMDGDWMVVESTRPGRGGGDPTTAKLYYKKG
jgi:hypothetical protein